MPIKRVFKYLRILTLVFFSFILIYLLSAYLLPKIAVNNNSNEKDEVSIFIKTNGVHTDIVVPVRNNQKDWSKLVKFENTSSKDTLYTYLGLGWGDKGFYLETPTWADLKTSVAFKAATGLSTTAIHATYFKAIKENVDCKKIDISKNQYAQLIEYIENSFQKDTDGNAIYINTDANYGKTDAFYEANGSYSLFHTCNTWANNGLKSCGQKCAFWTPTDTGIFLHYK
ncbi:MAG: TIGR02117 family protein [Leadbetterella sp.]